MIHVWREIILVWVVALDTARLVSRAAASCSGVRTSGSDNLTRCFARATWRLCLFTSLLFIPVLFAWLLHNPADHGLGREHERGDGSCILQGCASYLGGVDHAGLHQVFVLFGGGVETKIRILVAPDLLDHDGAFGSAVQHDLPHRLLACATNDGDSELLVALELESLQCDRSSQQCNASTGYDAFLDRCASGMQSVFYAGL